MTLGNFPPFHMGIKAARYRDDDDDDGDDDGNDENISGR